MGSSLSFSVQSVLISTGVLFLALLLKASVPLVFDFSVYQAPLIWSSLASWLKPPYLYVILNCIIITIAASSRFHHTHGADNEQQEQIPAVRKISARDPDQFHYDMKISAPESTVVVAEDVCEQREEKASAILVFEDKSTVLVNGSVEVEDKEDEDDFVISRSTWIPPKRMDSSENLMELLLPAEKPLVSARFVHRKTVRASPEGGRALRGVTKPKRHETLENTWKMITEGRAMPLTRHLKRCETLENDGRQINVCEVDPFLPKKSETFKDRTNYQLPPVGNSPAPGKLRKEPSLSQDELNRRVEAFIKKFNEEMRMQRQESLNQYMEMINRGSQ
ncbi:hypothetical protein P3X46_020395 [Hevea brasiliensis]|uniref:DUF4408 domain-containing protein n=1 Tax=Hevea brasiliensis TaxID=3981 RepID=A0ABQ9LLR8_HEVBR|nr:uncharacterized protein LOC110632732 [Hevea brasiliensis]KAJ9168919.1 hypothetical protein P3X46_020395 [Hevea brasiliensis]